MTREGIDQFMLNKNKNENSSVLPSRQYIRLELKVFPLYYLALHFIREKKKPFQAVSVGFMNIAQH